jgi:hypothetical protein
MLSVTKGPAAGKIAALKGDPVTKMWPFDTMPFRAICDLLGPFVATAEGVEEVY